MKIFKDSSPLEQKLQQVEGLMKELGIVITIQNGTININDFEIRDILYSSGGVFSLPRLTEDERIIFSD